MSRSNRLRCMRPGRPENERSKKIRDQAASNQARRDSWSLGPCGYGISIEYAIPFLYTTALRMGLQTAGGAAARGGGAYVGGGAYI
jgi:hypothetical protein